MEATKAEGLLEMLQKCNANLEVVQKAPVFHSETGRRVVGSFFSGDVFQSPGPPCFLFCFALGGLVVGFGGFWDKKKNKKWQ